MGRRIELTPKVEAIILQSFGQGNSYRVAAGLAGVNENTLIGWLKQGKAGQDPRLRKFYLDAMCARVLLEQAATESVKRDIMGGFFKVPISDREGHLNPAIDPKTGHIVRDEKGRPCFQTKQEFRAPNVKLAMRVLERLNRSEFGKTRGSAGPDWTELDRPESEEPEIDHHYFEKPLIQRVAEILTANKVEIPGYRLVPIDSPEKRPNSDTEVTRDAAEKKEKKS
jgi:hypothetical protein